MQSLVNSRKSIVSPIIGYLKETWLLGQLPNTLHNYIQYFSKAMFSKIWSAIWSGLSTIMMPPLFVSWFLETFLVLLHTVCWSDSQFGFASSWSAYDMVAPFASDQTLGVTKDSGDWGAAWTFNIHKVWIRRLNKSLELVRVSFVFVGWISEIEFHWKWVFDKK